MKIDEVEPSLGGEFFVFNNFKAILSYKSAIGCLKFTFII